MSRIHPHRSQQSGVNSVAPDSTAHAGLPPPAANVQPEYEQTLCYIPEVFVYRIAAQQRSTGHYCNEWGLDKPLWTGALRVVGLGNDVQLRFVTSVAGDGNPVVYAMTKRFTLVSEDPAHVLPLNRLYQTVADSSRYFVTWVQVKP